MAFGLGNEDIDFDLLATYLKALANPGRLELLWRLRFPASASEVTVRPRRRDAFGAGRRMGRTTVLEHLQKLDEAGLMLRVAGPKGGADLWRTNVPQLFALTEEIRKLSAIPPAPVDVEETMARPLEEGALAWLPGPKLIAAGGPWEGRLFPLAGPGPWSVGRSRSRDVALTYDPFISAEHAEVLRSAAGFALEPAAGARNAARVNFAEVPPGAARPLAHGDVVGLGRSVLVFHER